MTSWTIEILNLLNLNETFRFVNDRRFSWLCSVFLKSFQDWLNSFRQCWGNCRKAAGQKIFISWQTYEGLKISLISIIETTQFLLWLEIKYVPTECPFLIIKRYMKDPMQIKRGKCYSLVLLCLKSTCMYKHNQVNKGILFQLFLHIILLMSTIYFRVFIMVWLGFWFDDTRGLRWGITLSCFESFS